VVSQVALSYSRIVQNAAEHTRFVGGYAPFVPL
jgi:hypothetical protein